MAPTASNASSTMAAAAAANHPFTPSSVTSSGGGLFSSRDASMNSATTPATAAAARNLSAPEDTGVPWEVEATRRELRNAMCILSHAGLKLAAKWASEQLIGMPPASLDEPPPSPMELPQADDASLYAKSLMDLGEYAHAAAVLSHPNPDVGTISPPVPNLSSFGIFVRAYSMYLAGERRKEEELVELKEPLERTTLRNSYLTQLCEELKDAYESQSLDAFGLYVFGIVLKEAEQSQQLVGNYNHSALDVLMESLLQFPWNWSAWLDLAELCLDDPALHPVVEDKLHPLASHYMYHFFCAHVFNENQVQENAISVMDRLMYAPEEQQNQEESQGLFQHSPYLIARMAVAHYHLREYEYAQDCFVALRERDPYRLEDLDVYSNILYVQENRVALSQLAHGCVRVDKYRPETCCIVGNYYSLKSQRTKAVQYFQRALKLDRNYTSAWTLMGHEYVELKNTAAAMEAYRRAVDVNDRDYRAWYGLGQTYEFLNMHLYALFFYRKATVLRPYDARMWCAMGGCYLGLGKRQEAIRTYERAVSHNDTEGIATQKLASLYRQDGHEEKAARCYLRHLELRHQATSANALPSPNNNGAFNLETVINSVAVQATEAEALLFLASYHKRHGEYETAAMCCSRLLEYPGPEKEEGKALLREMRSRGKVGSSTTTPQKRRQSSQEQNDNDDGMEEAKDAEDASSFEFSP